MNDFSKWKIDNVDSFKNLLNQTELRKTQFKQNKDNLSFLSETAGFPIKQEKGDFISEQRGKGAEPRMENSRQKDRLDKRWTGLGGDMP